MPGVRDRHSGCVSAYMVEHDLFDFLLLSLPDNDWYSHKHGPDAQVHSIAQADLQLARVFEAAGGRRRVPRRTRGDRDGRPFSGARHGHDRATGRAGGARRARDRRAPPEAPRGEEPRIAVCPSQRAAMVYALHEAERDAMRASVVTRTLAIEGVEHVMWLGRDAHDIPVRGSSRARSTASCASVPAASDRGSARSVLERRRPPGGDRRSRSRRAPAHPRLSGRPRPRLVGAHMSDLGRGAAVGCAGLRVPRLGPPGRTWGAAATVRCTPATRSARWCSAESSSRVSSPPSGRSATSRRWCSGTSAGGRALPSRSEPLADPRSRAPSCARCRPRPRPPPLQRPSRARRACSPPARRSSRGTSGTSVLRRSPPTPKRRSRCPPRTSRRPGAGCRRTGSSRSRPRCRRCARCARNTPAPTAART